MRIQPQPGKVALPGIQKPKPPKRYGALCGNGALTERWRVLSLESSAREVNALYLAIYRRGMRAETEVGIHLDRQQAAELVQMLLAALGRE